MGGYVICVKDNDGDDLPSRCIRLKPEDFLKFVKLQSPELPAEVEIMDKSKGDWISKSITSIQVTWFVSQLVGRAVRKLPITTLELFTCAIVVCTAATYFAWWNKPLDVQRPIILDCEVPAAFLANKIRPLESHVSLFFDARNLGSGYELRDSQSVSCFILISLAFAAPHLIGWRFHFPTRTEQMLWRIASIMCAGIPILFILIVPDEKILAGRWRERVIDILTWTFVSAYFLVRAYLLVEVFVGLRSVPVDVYTAVNWSAYVPHI
jgi:hypothetical protein